MLAHARALLTSDSGPTAYIDADAPDTCRILREAARAPDFGEPVAVKYIPDADDPWRIVGEIMDVLPSGSFLAHSDTALDVSADADVTTSAVRLNERMPTNQHLRTTHQLAAYYAGLEMVEPGLVQLPK